MRHRSLWSRLVLLATVAAVFAAVAPTSVAAHDGRVKRPRALGMVIVESERSFDATWDALISALDANPNISIAAVVDHAAAAAGAGLDLEPNRVVVFGNPALGTPVMAASRTAGLDLPQKMHVWEEAGRVYVGYNSVDYLRARHDTGDVPTLDTIAGALAGLAEAASGNPPEPWFPGLRRIDRRPGLVTQASDASFEATWSRLLAAIDQSPAAVAYTIDHGANSGGALAPTRLVVFGNPNLGTPLMQASATAGIDLPLKILVWENADGVTNVTTNDVEFLRKRHRIRGAKDSLELISGAIANFMAAATGG